jgi:uncharacterized OB-fold protein
VRGITRAAAYLPSGVVDGRRVAGPDEDGFTMAATAVERLLDAGGNAPPIRRLFLAGDLPETADANLVRFLGAAIVIERFGVGEAGARAAVHAASRGRAGEDADLVVVSDLAADRTDRAPSRSEPHDDAAVALWISDSVRSETLHPPSERSEGAPWATAPFFRQFRDRETAHTADWVGDWDTTPLLDRWNGAAARPRPVPPPSGPVSQGAYVPRPRYLENAPSRWRFAAERCRACATVTFPLRGRCRQCGARDGLETVRLPRDGGSVVSTTTIGPGGQPTEFDEQVASLGPYEVVLVELVPGVRLTAQVTEGRPGEIAIGSKVATRLRRLYPMEGEWRYGRKAVRTETPTPVG